MGNMSPHRVSYSESGWITSPLFAEFLMWLREFSHDDEKIYLVLDCYSVHRACEMRELTQTLNTDFVSVPVGATDELQPLDRYIFGAMKSIAGRKWRRMYEQGEHDKAGKAEMGQILQASWEGVSPQVPFSTSNEGPYEQNCRAPMGVTKDLRAILHAIGPASASEFEYIR